MSQKDKTGAGYDAKRRKFLQMLGLGTAVLVGESAASQIRIKQPENQPGRILETGQIKNYIAVTLLRPEDLLSLELRYYNFNLSGNTLQKKGNPAFVIVVFQPQSIAEQAWNEDASGLETPTLPGRMMIGAESRLVFSIPDTITAIPLDINELLAWEKYDLVVNERAKQPTGVRRVSTPVLSPKVRDMRNKISTSGRTKKALTAKGLSKDERITLTNMLFPEENSRREVIVNMPENMRTISRDAVGPLTAFETSLEIPMRLYLSPTKLAGWKHLKKLSTGKGVFKETNRLFELWHTRMGTKTAQGIDESELSNEQRIVRALWADDAVKDYTTPVIEKTKDPFLGTTSLTNKDRHQLVHESSNFQIPRFLPPAVKARKLFLTTLGAWLSSEFIVDRNKLSTAKLLQGDGSGNSLNVLSWKHIATMGRDHYVEIVKAGNIMPFGHEAVLVKITERKPHAGTGTAANFKREFVIITEPVKDYNYRDSKGQFMNFCFSRVEFVTTTSPLLDAVKQGLVTPATGVMGTQNQFLIRSNNVNVPFKIKAEDLDGNGIDFALPLAFISTDAQDNGPNIDAFVKAYNNAISFSPLATLNGQKFTLAPQVTNGCDTAYVANDISFGAIKYVSADELQGFLPVMKEAKIIEPSYQKLTGLAQAVPVSLVDDKNAGNVFAKFNFPQAVNFGGQSDKTGGLAVPNFNLSGLSKAAGAFGGDLDKFKAANASADDFFKVSGDLPDPKLFGVFKLSDILDFVSTDKSAYDLSKPLSNRAPKIPNLVTEETATEIITSYIVKPKLKEVPLGFVVFSPADNAEFVITTQVKAKKNNLAEPSFSTQAWMNHFTVGLIPVSDPKNPYLIGIDFKEIRFLVNPGEKADVSVDMGNPCIVFGGPLSFINEINKLIPSTGFSDPPYLDVSLTGIKCGYTLAIPDLQMGSFTLSHISLGAEVNLPFTGGPLTLGFRFCERHQPFTLTIMCFGGGGFFGLELDLNGIRQIEAALEFGAGISINLGVASGAVSIMAGIYFKMTFESDHTSTELTGYVRINGAVCILGIITASIELYMGLTYLIDKEKAYGEASLKMKIEVLFISKSVTLHTQRTFAGNGSDPNFQMALTQGDWQEYCGAFAV